MRAGKKYAILTEEEKNAANAAGRRTKMSEATQFGEVRILHFGDVFFGSPFLSPAPEKSADRRRLQRETFERTMQTISTRRSSSP